MTPLQFLHLIRRNKLRRIDAAWIAGTSVRHIRHWLRGDRPIPQYVELLLRAYDEKLLTDEWLIKNIHTPIPVRTTDYH
jgi:hypothetical protein